MNLKKKSRESWGLLDMKYNWKTMVLEDFIDVNPKESLSKGTIAKKIAMEKIQPFTKRVPGYELEEYKGGTKFKNGDTIMARITPCLENGKTAMVDVLNDGEVGFGSTEYIVFRGKEEISDPHFVYYLVTSPLVRDVAIKSMVGSSGRQRVQTDVIQKLEIDVPELDEQKEIASILKSIDDKIALNNDINKNLFEQAQSLFKSWLIDFDPYNGSAPSAWKHGTVNDIIELHDSKRVPLSGNVRDQMEEIYPYYGAASLMDYVDDYLFDGIYLLLGEDGTVIDNNGFPILQYVDGKFWVNNHAHILTGKSGYSVELLYLLFSLTNVKGIVTGAVQPKISQQNLKSLPVIIPDVETLSKLNGIIQPMFAEILLSRHENERLCAIRDSLLSKLMSGEIDVSDIDF